MEKLRLKIIELCNESGLGVEPISFVIKDIYRDVQDMLREQTQEELEKDAE